MPVKLQHISAKVKLDVAGQTIDDPITIPWAPVARVAQVCTGAPCEAWRHHPDAESWDLSEGQWANLPNSLTVH